MDFSYRLTHSGQVQLSDFQIHKEREMALDEVKILASLDHTNIIKYIEHFEDRDSNKFWIVTDVRCFSKFFKFYILIKIYIWFDCYEFCQIVLWFHGEAC